MNKKNLKYYLALPYKTEIVQDFDPENPGWVARVVDLPGCITQADSFAELEEMIADAKRAWIESALEDGAVIPEPRPVEEFSGKFVARVPKSLHRKLVETAEKEGVSLNQYVSTALASAVGELQVRQAAQAFEGTQQKNDALLESLKRLCQVGGIEIVPGSNVEKAYTGRMKEELDQCFIYIENGNSETAKSELYALVREIRRNVSTSPLLLLQADLLDQLRQMLEQTTTKARRRKPEESIVLSSIYQLEQANYESVTARPVKQVSESRPTDYKQK